MLPVHYHPKVKKDLKQIDKQLAKEILTSYVPCLVKDRQQGILLSGELRGFYKFSFTLRGTAYRIIYTLEKNPEEILYIMYIGTRENAYQRLLRRL